MNICRSEYYFLKIYRYSFFASDVRFHPCYIIKKELSVRHRFCARKRFASIIILLEALFLEEEDEIPSN